MNGGGQINDSNNEQVERVVEKFVFRSRDILRSLEVAIRGFEGNNDNSEICDKLMDCLLLRIEKPVHLINNMKRT